MQMLEGEQAEDLGGTPAALELRQDAGTAQTLQEVVSQYAEDGRQYRALLAETVGAATLGGVRGGMELARLGTSENLAIGATSKGVKLADVINTFAPTAFDGVRSILMAAQDSTRLAMLNMARGFAESAALNIGQSLRETLSNYADMGSRAALASFTRLVDINALQVDEALRQMNDMSLPSIDLAADLAAQYQSTLEEMQRITEPARALERWAAEQQREQERLLDAIANIGRLSAWPEPAPRRRPVYLPEPEPAAEPLDVVQISESDWREVITLAITEGKATPAQLIQLALQYNYKAPGLTPPQWAEIEAVALAYKEHGHRYDSQEAFIGYLIRKGFSLSLATFKRWVNLYETLTGECIRPGRGSRKRRSM